MAQVDLRQLIGKLNTSTRAALEAAIALCVTRTNYNVEVEHWLLKLLEPSNTDFVALLRQCGVDTSRLTSDLTRTIDKLPTGNSRTPGLSPYVVALIREAWLIGSIDYAASATRSGFVLCALVSDESFARLAFAASGEFAKVSPDGVRRLLPAVLPKTDEAKEAGAAEAPAAPAVR